MTKLSDVLVDHFEEERLLSEFFMFQKTTQGFFVDVGGNRPSNAVSRQFVDRGWSGVLVEPIPENAAQFESEGWGNVVCSAVTSPEKAKLNEGFLHLAGPGAFEHSSLDKVNIDPQSQYFGRVKVRLQTLESVLENLKFNKINLMHVDTEGTELDVLKGFPFDRYSVDLILIEDWQRSSKLHRFIVSKRFRIIRRTGFNSWYVPIDAPFIVPFYSRLRLWKKIYISSHLKWLKHMMDLITK